jgi:hypothetical protein
MRKQLLACFLAICFIAALLYGRSLDPIPVRFPDTADAFLYDQFSLSTVATVLAVFGALSAWPMRVLARRAAKFPEDERGGADRAKGLAVLFGFMAWMGAFVTPLLVVYESHTYVALTSEGMISRDYWGSVERRPWSTLQHMELYCSDNRNPILRLHFEGGRSSKTVLDMQPYRATKEEALDRLERLRLGSGAPLIWREAEQQAAFRNRDDAITRCADTLLRQFPFQTRLELFRQLASG